MAVAVAVTLLSFLPRSASAQDATCGVAETPRSPAFWTFTGSDITWVVDTDDDGSFETNGDDDPCPLSDNGNGRYPDNNDRAIIPADKRVVADVDFTSSGEGPLHSILIESGSTGNADGTALFFNNVPMAVKNEVENNALGPANGLQLQSGNGAGQLDVEGGFTNSGNVGGGNSGGSVELLVGGLLDNNSGGSIDLSEADSLSLAGGVTNNGSLLANKIDSISVDGSDLRNNTGGTLEFSESTVIFTNGASLNEDGSSFDASNSTVVFDGGLPSINGSGSGGDGTVDLILSTVILKNTTEVTPSIDVRVDDKLTVNFGSKWLGSGTDMRFEGDTFAVLQSETETDAIFEADQIIFGGSTNTSVEGEVFSKVRVESNVSLDADFTIDGFLQQTSGTEVTVGSTFNLDLEQDAEINGVLDVNGTLQFSGEGTTSGGVNSDKIQDMIGTGTFEIGGLESTASGTNVEVKPNQDNIFDIGVLTVGSGTTMGFDANIAVSGDLTADGNLTFLTSDRGKVKLDGNGTQTITSDSLAVQVLESANGSSSNNIELASGTVVSVLKSLELTTNTLDVSQGTLYLESESGSHAIINYGGGDVTGNITARRRLTVGPDWYFLTSPEGTSYEALLEQNNQNDLWTQGYTGSDAPGASFNATNLWTYNEPSDSLRDNSWSRTEISGMSDTSPRGEGFIVFPFSDDDFDGSGDGFPKTINIKQTPSTNLSFTFPFSATDRPNSTTPDDDDVIDSEEGWNLLGNPYLTNIAWTEIDRTNVDEAVYVWEPANGYATFNGTTTNDGDSTFTSDGNIGPFQAFFAKAENGTDPATASYDVSISDIRNVQRDSIGDQPFLKSSSAPQKARILALDVGTSSLTETTKFTFRTDGTLGKDIADAYQLSAPGEIPSQNFLSLYSLLDNGNALSINNLPYRLEDKTTVPVHPTLKGCDGSSPYTGEATLSIGNTQNIPAGWSIQVKDTKTGDTADLRTSGYTFTIESSTPEEQCSSKRLAAKSTSTTQAVPALPSPEVVERPVTAKSGGPDTRFKLVIDPDGGSGSGDGSDDDAGSGNSTIEFGDFLQDTESSGAKVSLPADGVTLQHKFRTETFESIDPANHDAYTLDANTNTITINKGELNPGTHKYRLQIGKTGGAEKTGTKTSDVATLNVAGEELTTYPNPASQGQATVEFVVEKQSDVTVSLYNTLGQKVRTLHRGEANAGETMREMIDVQSLASGVYFVRMRGDGVMATTRMTIVK
jgi:hypothetical protein